MERRQWRTLLLALIAGGLLLTASAGWSEVTGSGFEKLGILGADALWWYVVWIAIRLRRMGQTVDRAWRTPASVTRLHAGTGRQSSCCPLQIVTNE